MQTFFKSRFLKRILSCVMVSGGALFLFNTLSAKDEKMPAPAPVAAVQRWDFKDSAGWTYSQQGPGNAVQYAVEQGQLKIWTNGGTAERKKMHTENRIYTAGRYRWRTYVPKMDKHAQVSVGSWIYHNDQHEIDFEVGYGKAAEREKYKAKSGELLAYMTTQGNPFMSTAVPIRPGWHLFEIDLSLRNGKYFVQWFIDGKCRASVQQTYGAEIPFYIFCSVENLNFIGDVLPRNKHTALFDFVEYCPAP